jgi:RNA polymerase sigma-70 factor (ECF subfamily)
MTPPTDHELMQQISLGAPRAFDELVRRWQSPLARILVRLSSQPQVDDLCQEVFVKVYLARARYRPEGAFSTWLYRIALNVVRDQVRRTRGWLIYVEVPSTESVELGPDSLAADAEEHESVRRAVHALPDKLREAVVLKHFGELPFAEVAQVLGIPLSTAKSRVETGLIELRRHLPAGMKRERAEVDAKGIPT